MSERAGVGGEDGCGAGKQARICRALRLASPSSAAAEEFHTQQLATAVHLESLGYTLLPEALRHGRTGGTATCKQKHHHHARSTAAGGGRGGGGGMSSGKGHQQLSSGIKVGRQTANAKFLSHLRELKLKRHDALIMQPRFLSPLPSERSGASAYSTMSAVLRDNANHVAICLKRKPSEAAAQQTTRVHIESLGVAEVTHQITTALVVGIGVSMAKEEEEAATSGINVCNPHCTFALGPNELLDRADRADRSSPFLCCASTNHFCEDAPRSVCKRDFLQLSTALATKQLENRFISSLLPQTTSHLDRTCEKVVRATDGTRLWFSWALLLYLVSDTRAHPMLAEAGFTDFDLAVADAALAYGRLQVGNRSRRQTDEFEAFLKGVSDRDGGDRGTGGTEREIMNEMRKLEVEWSASASHTDEDSDPDCDDNDYDDDGDDDGDDTFDEMGDDETASTASAPSSADGGAVSLQTKATATRAMRSRLLSRKMRRGPHALVDAASSGTGGRSGRSGGTEQPCPPAKRVRYTGAFGVRSLEFLHLHFAQADCGALVTPLVAHECQGWESSASKTLIANCSLKHLVSECSASAVRAADRVLKWQLESLQADADLVDLSRKAALHTRAKIGAFLMQNDDESPGVASWTCVAKPGDAPRLCVGVGKRYTGHAGSGRALAMVCCSPAAYLSSGDADWSTPPLHHKTSVAWARHTMRSNNADADTQSVSEAVESLAFSRAVATSTSSASSSCGAGGDRHRAVAAAARRADFAGTRVLPTFVSGLTRSVVTVAAKVLVNRATSRAARDICAAVRAHAASSASARSGAVSAASAACQRAEGVDGVHRRTFDDVKTPPTTPGNVFSVGMHMSECARFSWSQMHAKQSPLIAPLAPLSAVQAGGEDLVNPSQRPWVLLHPLDVRFEKRSREPVRTVFTERDELVLDEVPLAASVTVCGENATPVPSALRGIASRLLSVAAVAKTDPAAASLLRQWRSVLFMSGVQCSTLNAFANAVSAREANTCIDGTSKIHNPDNHRNGFFTPFQAFVVGHCNVPKMFANTSWHGAYGASYDCGAVASVGNAGKHFVSDGRLPVKAIVMGQSQVDALCARLGGMTAVPSVVRDDERSGGKPSRFYEATPTETWGMPRYLLPGVHTALRGLSAAFRTLRRISGLSDESDTVSSIQVLPFSPFTEAVPPVTVQGAWRGFRDRYRPHGGWSMHRTDSTLEEASVLSGSPLFASARVKMTQAADNIFETIDANAASVFVLATQIGFVAKLLHALRSGKADEDCDVGDVGEAMDTLRDVCDLVHETGPSGAAGSSATAELTAIEAILAFDALVLLNACAPLEFRVGEKVLLDAYAIAPSAAMRGTASRLRDLPCEPSAKAKAVRYWAGTKRIWAETTALVAMLHRHACTFDNSLEDLKRCSATLEAWVRSLWKLHSDDGVGAPASWSPFHRCASPEQITAEHINCVFVDRPGTPNPLRRKQRGAAFGLSNSAPNQILTLLTASFLPNVAVNHARNEGNICLRATCSALKRGECGEVPSLKSTSPVNSENDGEAYGDFSAKEAQARRQHRAWATNNALLFEACKCVSYDEAVSGRHEGSTESFDETSRRLAAWSIDGIVPTEQKVAEEELSLAVEGACGRRV